FEGANPEFFCHRGARCLFCALRNDYLLSTGRQGRAFESARTRALKQKPKGDMTMRFMMIVKASKESEAGVLPSEELIAAMTKYNEELAKAGALLDLSGLHPSSKGARVKFSGGKRTVIDGPFTEAKE